MADIRVNLKVKADAASAAQAAREMSNIVKSGAGGGLASSPTDFFNAQKWKANPTPIIKGGGGASGKNSALLSALGAGASQLGIPSIGTMARAGGAGIAIMATVSALMALKRAANEVQRSFERAASIYARQLQSGGISGGLMAQRSGLASVIGVGEHEVWQYGKAVAYLNTRLAFSAKINAETNRNVTGAAWSIRLLGEDMKALAMVAADTLAPAIRTVIEAMRPFIQTFGKTFGVLLGKALEGAMIFAFNMAFGPWGGVAYQNMKRHGSDPGPAPSVAASAKRMQSSPWERMGMVIGQGIGGNPLKATERNTRSAAQTLKEIKAFLAPRNSIGPNMKAIPNGA